MKRRLCTLFVIALLSPSFATRAEAAQTFHVLIAADTTDSSIGGMVKNNVKHLRDEVQRIAQYSGQKLNLRVVSGQNFTSVVIRKALRDLSPGKDDTVLFIYTGHGSRTAEKKVSYPNLNFHDQTVGLEEIFRTLRAKNPRLLLVFSDSCNNAPDQAIPDKISGNLPKVPKSSLSKSGYRKLFAGQSGAVIGSGTRPREFGMYSDEGGVFTNALRGAIKAAAASTSPSWEGVMRRASKALKVGTNVQRPIYKVYGGTNPDGKDSQGDSKDRTQTRQQKGS
jgi:hypothetical protein